ncbi:MAG: HEAT repeat domain-containing protein [Pirellulales bacterium]|nr:HEAT repeat domain-containing protein [Pirellulales bacterium]
MEHEPYFEPLTVVHAVPDGLIPRWLDALDRNDVETELVCSTARGFIRCHQLGIAIDRQSIERLAQQLHRQELALPARLGVARALVEVDAKQHAALLTAQLPRGGRDMAEIVEPALADWGDRSLRNVWLARLDDPQAARRELHLAIAGLGKLADPAAKTPLLRIVSDASRSLSLRVGAARSLAQLADAGLEADAERFLASSSADSASGLLAVYMLGRHSGPRTEQLLMDLSANKNPAVAATAVARLIDLHADLLEPKLEGLIHSSDARVRLLGIRAVERNSRSMKLALLGEALGDEHLDVRRAATRALVQAAEAAERRAPVCQLAITLVDAAHPIRTEQALLILGELDYEKAAPRALELLDAHESAVSIAAAWTLERLAAEDVEEQILSRLVLESDRSTELANRKTPQSGETPLAEPAGLTAAYSRAEHLIIALGRMRCEPAVDLLQRFLPKPNWQPGDPPLVELVKQPRLRAAAVWALGMIYADQATAAPAELVEALVGRLSDTTPIPREEPFVRRMAAVSLGRIKAPIALEELRRYCELGADGDEVSRACGWAIEHITGVPARPPGAKTIRHVDWFLVPLD